VQILARNPLIGRPVKGGKRELVIGEGSRGRFVAIDTVFVLAIRSHRESGHQKEAPSAAPRGDARARKAPLSARDCG